MLHNATRETASIRKVSCAKVLEWVTALLFVFAVPTASAKTHPVPLDKNTDSAKCIECHADKTQGKFVHSAIATGCMSCHEIRVNRDITRVKLITATPYKLCLTCHADKDASKIQGQVHKPGIRDCLTCHDPHGSDNKNLLVKATSGDQKDNLCLSCHTQGTNVPEKGSRHAALDMGCDTCHTIHKTGPEPTIENRFHLTKAAPALCVDCHDPKDADLQKAHHGQPFGTANCLECHDPHQSAVPHLMAKFEHPPFASGDCDTCHAPAKDGKVVLTQADSKSLCITCHGDQEKLIEDAKVPHPGAQASDCVDCHSPHASAQPGLPKTDTVSICLGCHSEIADLQKKSVRHQPVFGQGCYVCHEAHGSNNEHLLRAAGNALCMECHGPESRPQKVESENLVTIFGGKVELPGDYFRKNRVEILPLQYGVGHPVENHPVQDVVDPTDSSKVKVHITCLTCHQPHASTQPGMLVNDQADNMAFCDTCHKNRLDFGKTRVPGRKP
jgi:predicted CXXCH cytochrome family protein